MSTKVMTIGVFDLFHSGHLKLLQNARKLGDILIVAMSTSEGTFQAKGKYPIMSLEQRMRTIQKTGLVDNVIAFDSRENEGKLIELIHPDIICRGDDNKDFPGRDVVEKLGIKIVFFPYTKGVSTTEIREEVWEMMK